MKKVKIIFVSILVLTYISSCSVKNNKKTIKNIDDSALKIKSLRFIGEQVIPEKTLYNGSEVGGLSSIDYANGKYYLISDDKYEPIRFYEMNLDFNKNEFSNYTITNSVNIQVDSKGIDPESLRYDKESKHFFWSSEGHSRKGIDPVVYEINKLGGLIKKHQTPNIFKSENVSKNKGTRRNGTFEGLSMSVNPDFYWVGMELPLKQDGEEPQLNKGKYPIRISKINKKTDDLVFQFAYLLSEIPKNSIPENKFIVNGSPEILEIDQNRFLILERAYASGHKDGGNTVKIYLVDISNATNISNFKTLKGVDYVPAKKQLLFNFDTIRSKLTNGIVDNIEGITFGKVLANGNKTLVVVSDNNFNKFSKQLNQIIVLEIEK